MNDTVKLLVVHSDSALPDGFQVTIQDFRDTILNHPEAFVNALKGAIQGAVPSAGGAIETGGSLPMDTPLFKMLPADLAKLLSPSAQKLTKGDLLALANNTKTPADLSLTVADLQTIQDAFHLNISNETRAAGLGKVTINKCCCSPCCCCTAATVVQPLRLVA